MLYNRKGQKHGSLQQKAPVSRISSRCTSTTPEIKKFSGFWQQNDRWSSKYTVGRINKLQPSWIRCMKTFLAGPRWQDFTDGTKSLAFSLVQLESSGSPHILYSYCVWITINETTVTKSTYSRKVSYGNISSWSLFSVVAISACSNQKLSFLRKFICRNHYTKLHLLPWRHLSFVNIRLWHIARR